MRKEGKQLTSPPTLRLGKQGESLASAGPGFQEKPGVPLGCLQARGIPVKESHLVCPEHTHAPHRCKKTCLDPAGPVRGGRGGAAGMHSRAERSRPLHRADKTSPNPENHPPSGLQNTDLFWVARDPVNEVEIPPTEAKKRLLLKSVGWELPPWLSNKEPN